MSDAIPLDNLKRRLEKIGVQCTFVANYPWIYLDTVNGNKVEDKFLSKHKFTVAFLPVRIDKDMSLTDTSEIFRVIRKYR
jgi:hypothetical protein